VGRERRGCGEKVTVGVKSYGAGHRRPRRIAASVIGLVGVSAVGLSACTSAVGSGPARSGNDVGTVATGSAVTPPSAATAPAVISASPAPGTRRVNPVSPVSVSVTSGRLTSVVMRNPVGKKVTAALSTDGKSWHTTEVLGYDKRYSIRAKAVGTDGKTTVKRISFTTLNPPSQTMPYLQRMGGYALGRADTYGVGIIPVVHFDEPIRNEAAAQKTLKITTSKPVAGVWSWIDDTDVAYRPKHFWPAHTKVTLAAEVYGKRLGRGLYGASDVSSTFTVGRRQITQAHDNAPNSIDWVDVYNGAGKLLRKMKTSMGQHSGEWVGQTWINFYTVGGTATVLDHENPAYMSSQSYGLPQNDPNGYGTLTVPYSTKITTDGIYLHEYNSTIYDQDNGIDVSEGCLNLRTADAVWFYDHSIAGDPVIVHPAKGAPTISPGQGGYWSIPWSTWVKNSASSS
jgi:lipoprotein-anchoring transpeptidase ErfK/SrfK